MSCFESFSRDDTLLLNSSLILNHRELFEQLPKTINVIYCFDSCDEGFLPVELNNTTGIIFGDTYDKKGILKTLHDKYFNESPNNLILFPDSIGMTAEDIQKVFNLLQIEDEVIVLGKTYNDKVACVGFNSFNKELFYDIIWDNLNYDYMLAKVSRYDNLIHVMGNYMVIKSTAEFKHLYSELSKKESLAYCSQNMHERFTHLFIEYKDLLK
jgi:hypothetical protein